MTLPQFKDKFNLLVQKLNNNTKIDLGFSTVVTSAYEALVLAEAMTEYGRVHGGVTSVQGPPKGVFLNQSGGYFRSDRAFKVTYVSGKTFLFAADIEVFGLQCTLDKRPHGMKFEADVVVIEETHIPDVLGLFRGYPAPQHLDAVYECKFGKYDKGQLRELLGLRRHLSKLVGASMTHRPADASCLHDYPCLNADPAIPVKMARPKWEKFFDEKTGNLYDLQQLVIN